MTCWMTRMSCSAIGLTGVDEDDRHLGLLQRRLGAQRGVEVGPSGLVHAPPDAGRVDEPPRLAAELDELVDGVAGGAGDGVDDDPVVTGQLVEQRGLADVRAGRAARPGAARRALAPPTAETSGSTSSTASSTSPLPRPCSADTGHGWPRPRFHSAAASASKRWSSTLFATSTTGLPDAAQQLDDRLVGVGGADHRVDDEERRHRRGRRRPRPARPPAGGCRSRRPASRRCRRA